MHLSAGPATPDSPDGWIFLIVRYYPADLLLFANVVAYSRMSFWSHSRYNVLMLILMVARLRCHVGLGVVD